MHRVDNLIRISNLLNINLFQALQRVLRCRASRQVCQSTVNLLCLRRIIAVVAWPERRRCDSLCKELWAGFTAVCKNLGNDGTTAGALSPDGDVLGVAAKLGDVLVDPFQGCLLVEESAVQAVSVRLYDGNVGGGIARIITDPGFRSDVGDSLIFLPGRRPNAFVCTCALI